MSRPLWTTDAMAAAMGAQRTGNPEKDITGISIDSRSITPGEAFFAIKGDVHDGHNFVAKALENSCLLYTSPSPRDGLLSRMPSSA